jgi:hypothetical protein
MNAPEPLRVSACPHCKAKPLFVPSNVENWKFKLEHEHEDCPMSGTVVYHHDAKRAAKRMAQVLCDKWIKQKVMA